jgi:Pentapeptide repeats (8 copies)
MHVFKRMAAWPWTIRSVLAVLTAAVAFPGLYVLLWYGPDVLARHDVGSAVSGPLRVVLLAYATGAARGQLLTIGAGIFAAGALIFTARNFTLSREGQLTDRYTKAVEQLGSDKLDVRIGGIYALERLARNSPEDHPTVMEVLSAFIREHSREQRPVPRPDDSPPPEHAPRPDVQAAITVICRRDATYDQRRIDLVGTYLRGADLRDANLALAYLTGADLSFANFVGAKLAGAILELANLSGAFLGGVDLHGASFASANLTGANLSGADLSMAVLADADLSGADLFEANLAAAGITGANFAGADLTEVNLTGEYRGRGIEVHFPQESPPEGWVRDSDSGRLMPADAGGADAR